jgi:hypothetical protein
MRKWDSCGEEDREDEETNLTLNIAMISSVPRRIPGAQPDVAVILLASCTVNLE